MIALTLMLAATEPPRLTALLMRSEGTVTIGEGAAMRRVGPRQAIRSGEVVHVAESANAVLLCSTDWWVSLSGPKQWILDPKGCRQGRALPSGSFDSLVVDRGRIRSVRGGMTVELDTRSDGVSGVPVVLAPRNTKVLDPRPVVIWTEVPGAVQYEIEWLGAGSTPLKISAADAKCAAGTGFWRGLNVCSAAYPDDRAPLKADAAPLFLRVGSRFSIASPLRAEKDAVKVRVADVNERKAFQQQLETLQKVPVGPNDRLLLIAGAYAASGFLGEALSCYNELLTHEEVPEARVTLGDLALAIGLPSLASREYSRVLEDQTPGAASAAAEFGLGRAALVRSLFVDARDHFARAQELFHSVGLMEDAEMAKTGVERSSARVPR